MAKTTTATGTGRTSGTKSSKSTPRKASSRSKSGSSRGSKSSSGRNQTNGAADALVKLIESPLVAELLAVGASAALAAFAAQGFGRRTEDGRGTRRALKAAAKSAAVAMGARLSTEVQAIREASKKSKQNEAA